MKNQTWISVREFLEMIAGTRQCPDNLMGNVDIAKQALALFDIDLDKSIDLRKELYSGDKVHLRCGGEATVADVRYTEGTDTIQVYFLESNRSSPMTWFTNGSFEFNKGHPLDIIKVTQAHSSDLKDVEVLRDALHEIIDQVSEHTGPMPMVVREIAKQALGEKD